LHGEDPDTVKPPYRYEIVCRRSGPRIAIASIARSIIEHLLENVLSETMAPGLRRISFVYTGTDRVKEVENVLRFLRERKYLKTPIWEDI
jgi:hypothetical protein